MDESKAFAPELSPAGSRQWIGRLVIAVVLGAAIWNFVVSLTINVVVPGLARLMESEPQSPLYLGKGEVNVAAIFISLLELCFAAMAAVVVNSISTRRPKVARRKIVSTGSAAMPARVPISPPAAPTASLVPAPRVEPPRQAIPPLPSTSPAPPVPTPAQPAAKPQAAPAAATPPKSTKPKKVYYNIVGERIEEDDD